MKVVDFGVALSKGGPPMQEGMNFNGKMAYMSAEQARGDELDRRADVHSLGIILWELVTGRRLFRGRNDLETILNVLDGNVPRPTMLNHACPQALERIVMKALAARPSERFPTAQDFARALTEMRVRHMDTCAPPDVADWVATLFPEDTAETHELPHGEATIRRTPRAG